MRRGPGRPRKVQPNPEDPATGTAAFVPYDRKEDEKTAERKHYLTLEGHTPEALVGAVHEFLSQNGGLGWKYLGGPSFGHNFKGEDVWLQAMVRPL